MLGAMCSFVWVVAAMQIMMSVLILPELEKHWNLDGFTLGLIGSAPFFGTFIGSYIFGLANDRYGRRPTYLWAMALLVAFSIGTAVAPNPAVMVVMRIGVGAGAVSDRSLYLLLAEFTPINVRAKYLLLSQTFWPVGAAIGVAVGWAMIPRFGWRIFLLTSAAPGVIGVLFYFCMPESARFFLINGRRKEAEAVLLRLSRMNGIRMPCGVLATPRVMRSGSFGDLMHPSLKQTTFLLWATWALMIFMYYGVAMAPADLFQDTDFYLALLISSIAEIPANILPFQFIDFIGRKKTIVYINIGFAVISLMLIEDLQMAPVYALRVTAIFFTRFMVSASFSVLYIYTTEFYPTIVRGVGISSCSMFSRMGAVASMFHSTVLSGSGWFAAYTVASVISAVLTYKFPTETCGKPLRDEIEDEVDTTISADCPNAEW
eukprot:21979_1